MNKNFKLELRDQTIYIDGYPKTEDSFTKLLKEALNHRIVFQNAEKVVFCVEKQFGDWVVQPVASAPVGFKYFYFHIKELLEKNGPVATLHQDTFWLDCQ